MKHITARISDIALDNLNRYAQEHKCSLSASINTILEAMKDEHTMNTVNTTELPVMNTVEHSEHSEHSEHNESRLAEIETRLAKLESQSNRTSINAKDFADEMIKASKQRNEQYIKQIERRNQEIQSRELESTKVAQPSNGLSVDVSSVDVSASEPVNVDDSKWIELIKNTEGRFTYINDYRIANGFSKQEYESFCDFLSRNEDSKITILRNGKKATQFRSLFNNEPKLK